MKLVVGFLSYRLYKLEKEMKALRKDNEKFKREETVRRNVGFDSLWKAMRGF